MRRKENKITYPVTTERGRYFVTLDRIKNDRNGNPRFEANIIVPGENTSDLLTVCYTFTGHYFGEAQEAAFIVNHFEKSLPARASGA